MTSEKDKTEIEVANGFQAEWKMPGALGWKVFTKRNNNSNLLSELCGL